MTIVTVKYTNAILGVKKFHDKQKIQIKFNIK